MRALTKFCFVIDFSPAEFLHVRLYILHFVQGFKSFSRIAFAAENLYMNKWKIVALILYSCPEHQNPGGLTNNGNKFKFEKLYPSNINYMLWQTHEMQSSGKFVFRILQTVHNTDVSIKFCDFIYLLQTHIKLKLKACPWCHCCNEAHYNFSQCSGTALCFQ
jgi:hypothetical protein